MSEVDIINNLIAYNITILAQSKVSLCNKEPRHPKCVVSPNTYEDWLLYLKNNRDVVFEKGYNRLYSWRALLNDHPFLYFPDNSTYSKNSPNDKNVITQLYNLKISDKYKYYFILAACIIIFQVFSDGNHRTAMYFYNKSTGNELTKTQLKAIDNIRRNFPFDYYNLNENPDIIRKDIIPKLLEISDLVGGFKKRKSRKYKNKKRIKLKKSRKTKKR